MDRGSDNKNRLLYDPNQRRERRLGAFSMGEDTDEEETEEKVDEQENEEKVEENNNQEQQNKNNEGKEEKQQEQPKQKRSSGIADAGKEAIKKGAKVVGKKILAFIAANPWVLLVIAVVLILLFVILYFADDSANKVGYYDEICNFNSANVVLNTCNESNSSTLLISEYVLGVTNALVKDKDYDNETIKAIMIVVKTNAFSYGGYNSSAKTLNLDDCTYSYDNDFDSAGRERLSSLYNSIENYLFLSTSYTENLSYLYSSDALALDDTIIEEMNEIALAGNSYGNILNAIYNSEVGETPVSEYKTPLFIGDSRTQGMLLSNVISENNTVYGSGLGYNWFIGNGSFSSAYTNAVSGGINGINAKMVDGKSYNIVIWLGVNDISNIDNYYQKYYELATGEWKNHVLNIVSVGPVDDSKSTTVTNEMINNFNSSMSYLISNSNVTNLKFININYNISSYSTDGLHYSSDDYKNIFNMIQSHINNGASDEKGLYDLDSYCTFYNITDNELYWWPIGSATATNGNIYGGLPTATTITATFAGNDSTHNGSHGAIDIGASCNDNVVIAAKAGTVIKVSDTCANNGYYGNKCGGGYGNYVYIEHDDGVVTRYAHMYPGSIVVSEGEQVEQGQKIGMVGTSGSSTGCHLHFEVRVADQKVDPLDYVSPDNPRPVSNYSFKSSGDSSNQKQYICKSLLSTGYSVNAVAGVMANFQAESGFVSYRLQGDYSSSYTTSLEYTEKVDNGTISKYNFMHNGPNGGGYGLAQWTYYTRKEGLYDYAKSKSASIGQLEMQLAYFVEEVVGYTTTYKYITGNYSAIEIAKQMCLEYENPAHASTNCPSRANSNVPSLLTYVRNGCN